MDDYGRLVRDCSGTEAAASGQLVAYRFGPFRFTLTGRILEREGIRVAVTPKVADTLLALLQRAGEVVSKEELIAAVWPDVVVAESGLTRNIAMLRQALGEADLGQRFIETVPRRGYRFVGTLEFEHAEFKYSPGDDPRGMAATGPGGDTALSAHAAPAGYRLPPLLAVAAFMLFTAVSLLAWFTWQPQPAAEARPIADSDVRIGRHLLHKLTPAETERARDYFRRSIAANPNSAEGHAGAALALVQLSALGSLDAGRAVHEAAPLAARALALQPGNPSALASQGAVLLLEGKHLHEAETYYRRALKSDPQSVSIRFGYSVAKLANGDMMGARALVEQALQIDPASPRLGAQLGRILYLQRDFSRAAEECRRVLDREPGYALAHYYLALSLGYLGQWEDAYANLDAARLNADVLATDRTWLDAMRGDSAPALRLLAERRQLVNAGKLDASANLLLAATLRDTDAAREAIDATMRRPAAERIWLDLEPRLDALRDNLLLPAPYRGEPTLLSASDL